MLDIASEREIEGDLILGDMGLGLPFKPGSFDGVIRLRFVEIITHQAMKAGFGGGLVVDFPNSSRAKKMFLVLFTGGCNESLPKALGDGDQNSNHVSVINRRACTLEYLYGVLSYRDVKKRSKSGKPMKKSREWILKKKDRARKLGKSSPGHEDHVLVLENVGDESGKEDKALTIIKERDIKMVSINNGKVLLPYALIFYQGFAKPQIEIRITILNFNISSSCLRRNCLEDRLNIIFREGNHFESIYAIDLSNFRIDSASSDVVAHFFPTVENRRNSKYDISMKITGFDPIFKFSRICDATTESFEYIGYRNNENTEFLSRTNLTAQCFDVEFSAQKRKLDAEEVRVSGFSKKFLVSKEKFRRFDVLFWACLLLIAVLVFLTGCLMYVSIFLVLKYRKTKADECCSQVKKCNVLIIK
uniref:18S rRNA (guanine(1575)-N(7))-methyltransferase Bud23 C-terminal domain-containing protein n=1 Tax=Romanomermis culicivorax TaxID=13658 RepID=A0A915IPZ6_ROMCU